MCSLSHKANATKACLWLFMIVSLMSSAAQAGIPDDITSLGDCLKVTPATDYNGEQAGRLFDKVLDYDGWFVLRDDEIRLDWSGCTTNKEEALVQGVFLFNKPENGATYHFYVGNDSGEE